MGRIKQGILGGIHGTVGTVIGSNWKGISYLRGKAASRRSSSSIKQTIQRARFKLISDFLGTISGLLRFSFKNYEVQQTGRNHAMAHNMEKAITGTYPDLALDYSKILVTKGVKLAGALMGSASAGNPGVINFSWQGFTGKGKADLTDKPVLVVYCPELEQSTFLVTGVNRADGTASINVPAFSGKEVHTWLSFQAADQSQISSSLYTGLVQVQ